MGPPGPTSAIADVLGAGRGIGAPRGGSNRDGWRKFGAGHIGQALARAALRAGRKVVIANGCGPGTLAPVVAALGTGV
jgi:hypothetical protein